MTNLQETEGIDKIKKTIKHLSQTAEYNARNLLTKMGYVSDPLYYKDQDPESGIEVIRLLPNKLEEIEIGLLDFLERLKNSFVIQLKKNGD